MESLGTDDWCYTQAPEDTVFSFAWTLAGFRRELLSRCGKYMKSNKFCVTIDNMKTNWVLVIFPNGDSEDNKGFVSLNIKYLGSCGASRSQDSIFAEVEFSILQQDGEKHNVHNFERKFLEDTFDTPGYSRFISHADLVAKGQILTPEHKFTVHCLIKLKSQIRLTLPIQATPRFDFDLGEVGRDLGRMLLDGSRADLKLVCGQDKEVINCHTFVLTARSTVFAAMFTHDMLENKEKTVHIEDLKVETVKDMLTFMYTGTVDNVGDPVSLLVAAEKYHLPQLNRYCQTVLCQNIGLDNCLDLLILSYQLKAQQLKDDVQQFIQNNTQEFLEIPDWEERLKQFPELLCHIFKYVIS